VPDFITGNFRTGRYYTSIVQQLVVIFIVYIIVTFYIQNALTCEHKKIQFQDQ
jgi:hypothetical protein